MSPCGASLDDLLAAEDGGATVLQLREKGLPEKEFLEKACALRQRLHIPLIINDNVAVAKACDADGVHIGQSDAELSEARRLLGPDKIIGVSCTTVAQALAAEAGGADYLGVGAVFPTGTKLDAEYVTLDTLRAICLTVRIPVVAIGGIALDNLPKLAACGLAGTAVVSALFAETGQVCAKTAEFAAANAAMLAVPPVGRKAVLCDFDGLLLDSLHVWNEVDVLFLNHHACFTEKNLQALRNSGTLEEAAEKMQTAGLDISTADFKKEIMDLLCDSYHNRLQLFPGAREFLEQQKASGARLALITASPERLVGPVLDRLELRQYFDLFLLEANKHTPEIFYHAMEFFGTSRQETIVYDDLPRIQDVARAAGFAVFGSINE